ncbi:hypothetical protein PoB_007497400, partial [Plakobranchus ocellatus]
WQAAPHIHLTLEDHDPASSNQKRNNVNGKKVLKILNRWPEFVEDLKDTENEQSDIVENLTGSNNPS